MASKAAVECKYIRDGKLIKDAESGDIVQEFKSINAAKKWSRQTQGLAQGAGLVKVKKD